MEVLAKELQLITKACCILACQVPPLPGLLLCSPGSCLSSLGAEKTLLAYLQGLQPTRDSSLGDWTPSFPWELQNILGRDGSSDQGSEKSLGVGVGVGLKTLGPGRWNGWETCSEESMGLSEDRESHLGTRARWKGVKEHSPTCCRSFWGLPRIWSVEAGMPRSAPHSCRREWTSLTSLRQRSLSCERWCSTPVSLATGATQPLSLL